MEFVIIILIMLLNISGVVTFFTGPFALFVVGAIAGVIDNFLLKGAPFPRILIWGLAFIIGLVIMFLTKRPVLHIVLLILCIEPILANLYGFLIPKEQR